DPAQPIIIILDDPNYLHWSSVMKSFLKWRKLWRIVIRDKPAPVKRQDETDESFADRLEDWDSANHILTWFTNTSVPSINMHFSHFDLAKEAWDFIANRYTSADLPHQYQLLSTLNHLRQESGQSIDEFHSHMSYYWGLPAVSEPKWHSLSELISEETKRLSITSQQSPFIIATTSSAPPQRPDNSKKPRCTHCHRIGHAVNTC
ncbi:LOW QUALITY PROTEIN: UBN2_3 domain-containing protein, partial [Cephalotus follicularis]